jgi:hypothetical protein
MNGAERLFKYTTVPASTMTAARTATPHSRVR